MNSRPATKPNLLLNRMIMLCFSLVLAPVVLQAQSKWKGWIVPEAGMMTGSYEPSGDLRLQGGIHKTGWMIGIGTALDFYRYQSVPVYVQGRKMFGHKNWKPFVMTSMGVNIPTTRPAENLILIDIVPTTIPKENTNHYNTGFYGEAGAGYAFLNKRGRGFLISFNYVQKRTQEIYYSSFWTGSIQTVPIKQENIYIMNRFAIRIGWKI